MELEILHEQRDLVIKSIIDLETKSYFVKAYTRFIKSSDFQLYKNLKKLQYINKDNANIDRIKYLETYGVVSDVLYLKESCNDVKKYIKLKKLYKRINNEINHLSIANNSSKVRIKAC